MSQKEYNSNYDPHNRYGDPGQLVPPPQQRPVYREQPSAGPQQNQQMMPRGQYQPPPVHHPQPDRRPASPYRGAAIASLIVGICSIVFFFHIVLSGMLAMAGVITGIVYLSKRKDERGLAIAGIATSIVGFLISILFLVLIFSFLGGAGRGWRNNSYYPNNYERWYEDFYDEDVL